MNGDRNFDKEKRMNNEDSFSYQAEVEWAGERRGNLRFPNLPTLEVAAPPEFQGPGGGWTPECLYVGSVASCFMLTFLALAERSKLDLTSLAVSAKGKLERVEGIGFQITEIVLKPKLVIRSAGDLERAGRIIKKAEKSCLISNSIKTAVRLEPEIYHKQIPTSPCPPVTAGTTPAA